MRKQLFPCAPYLSKKNTIQVWLHSDLIHSNTEPPPLTMDAGQPVSQAQTHRLKQNKHEWQEAIDEFPHKYSTSRSPGLQDAQAALGDARVLQ